MEYLLICLLILAQGAFADNATNLTYSEERSAVKCFLGEDERLDDYHPFSPVGESHYHIPSIRMDNCSEEGDYPECFPGMFQQIDKVHELIWRTNEHSKHSYISLGTPIHAGFIQVLRNLYGNITAMTTPDRGWHNNCFTFNLRNWEENMEWHENNYKRFHSFEAFFRELYNWHYVYFPIAFPILLTVGLLGNLTVLLILARNHMMWTTANKVVLNLAIADILFLVFNVGIFYLSFHDPKLMSTALCYVKVFGENLATAACVYSTALLSFLRYMAIAAITRGCPRRIMRFRGTIPVLLGFIWVLAAIAAIPNVVHIKHSEFDCDKHEQQQGGTIGLHRLQHMRELETSLGPHLTRLIMICILPLTVIMVFSIATMTMLRQSARNIPGEQIGLGNARQEREKGAYITLAVVTVFIVTHVPIHIANLIFLYRKTFGLSYDQCLPLLYVPRILFPLNSCLNPIALFIASKSFRKYLKQYLPCWSLRKSTYHSCRAQTQETSVRY